MNQPTHDQVHPAQSSAPLPAQMSPSDAARVLAERRTALREAAAQAQEPIQDPTEEAIDEQPFVDSSDADGRREIEGTEADDDLDSSEQPEDQAEGAVEVIDLDGEEVPISQIKEWRDGAMRQEDYTRKTQVLTQQSKAISELESKVNSYAHAMNKQFQQQQQELAAGLQRFQSIDWVKLAQADPAKYTAAKAAFDAHQGEFQRKQQQWNEWVQEHDALGNEALRLRAQAALPEIKSRIKGWNDAMYAERSDFLVERYGFDRGMVNRITDPQFWELAHDAYTYRKAAPTTKAKVKRTPTITPRSTSGAAPKMQQKAVDKSVMQAIQTSSGRSQMESAAALLASRRAQHQR